MKRSGLRSRQPAASGNTDPVMAHHRAAWRVERASFAIILLLLVAALLGVFGDGPLSRARSESGSGLAVEYDRLLRASAPTRYRFLVDPSLMAKGALTLRVDNSLVDVMELESVVPQPRSQSAGPMYTQFSFQLEPGQSRAAVLFRFRPATFGRRTGEVSVPGAPPLSIDHFIYP